MKQGQRGGKESEKRASSLVRTKDFGVFGLRAESERKQVQTENPSGQNMTKWKCTVMSF
jgi:hypothetical protein